MTKQDTVTEQPTSQPQTSGETVSRQSAFNPPDLSNKAMLRKAYKKMFGYKPVGFSEKQLEQMVEAAEINRQSKSKSTTSGSRWKDSIPEENLE